MRFRTFTRNSPPKPKRLPVTPTSEAAENGSPMTFLEHLEDLRRAILRSVLALFLGMCVAAPFAPQILEILTQPLWNLGKDPAQFLAMPQVMGSFKVAISLIFWSGVLLAAPLIVFIIAQFVFPGLHRHERQIIRRSAFFAVFLFFGGAALGYFSSITLALDVLLFTIPNWIGVSTPWIFTTDYISFVLKLILGFGLAFELPLVVLILGYAGLVDAASLRHYRRHTVIVLLVIAMVLTPPEPVSQVIMATSLYILFEICILIIARHERRT